MHRQLEIPGFSQVKPAASAVPLMQSGVLQLVLSILAAGLSSPSMKPASADDWIGFRGGRQYGVASSTGLPVTWNDDENVLWKRDLPGPGGSSPIVVGNRLLVTCYSGYAESIDQPGEMDDLRRHVVCLNRKSGEILWEKTFEAVLPESRYSAGNNSQHGYASSTPTSDGERFFVQLGITGVHCFDLEGKPIWQADVGSGTHNWGSGASPLLAGDLLIVNASIESGSLIGLDKKTGREVWRTEEVKKCWSSPIFCGIIGRADVGHSSEHA